MAEEVGAAFVSLIPSARGFSRLAQREIKNELRGSALTVPVRPEIDRNMETVRIPAVLDPVRTGIAEGTRIRVPAEVDASQMRRQTRKAIVETEATHPTVHVSVDTDGRFRDSLGRFIGGGATKTVVEREGRGIGSLLISSIGGVFSSSGSSGGGLLSGISTVGSAIGGTLITALTAAAIPLVAAAGFAIATALAAAISAAFIAGSGLAVIGLGAWILKDQPQVAKAASDLLGTVKKVFASAAQPLVGPITQALGIFRDLAVELGPQLHDMFAAIAPAIVPLARGIAGFIREAMPGFISLIQSSVPFLKDLESTLPRFGENLSHFFNIIAQGWPGASQFFRDLLNLLGATLVIVGFGITLFSQWYLTTRDVVTGIGSLLKMSFLGWKDMIGGVVGAFQHLGAIISAIWKSARTDTSGFISYIASLPGQIVRNLGNLGNLLYQAGRNVVMGLINGIRSMLGQLGGMASRMAGTIRAYLPFSPAKTGPLSGSGNPFISGQTIATMLAGGMKSQLPAVSSASSQLAGAVSFGSSASSAAAAPAAIQLGWDQGATGDPLLDGIRSIIGARWAGDPVAALRS